MQTQETRTGPGGATCGKETLHFQNTVDSIMVSTFESGMDTKPNHCNIHRVVDGIKTSPKIKATIERLRSLPKAEYDQQKKSLPAVTFGGTFSKRGTAHLIQHSGLVVLDLDDLGDKLPAAKAAIEADEHVAVSFISPSGVGLKVVLRVGSPGKIPDDKRHKDAWGACADHVSRITGLPISGAKGEPRIDQSGKDVSRLCFLSHDPTCFYRHDALPLPLPEKPRGNLMLDLSSAKPHGKQASGLPTQKESYGKAALKGTCDEIRTTPEGERNLTLAKGAYCIGGYLHAGLDKDEAHAELLKAATDAGLPEAEARGTIEGQLKAGSRKPRNIPERRAGPSSPGKPLEPLPTRTAKAIYETDFPPIRWILDGVLTEGLAVLAGKPKKGKSWLALALSVAVTLGGTCLDRKAHKGDVLYLALEDGERRIKTRLRKLLREQPAPENLHFIDGTARLGREALHSIFAWMDDHQDCRLVVIDTLKKLMPAWKAGANQYDAEYNWMAVLQREAIARNVCILGVVHCRKAMAEDPFDLVSGTLGMTAACDGILVLAPSASDKADAILHVTGRDIKGEELALCLEDGTWTVKGDAESFMTGETKNAVMSLFQDHTELMPRAVVKLIGLPSTAVRKALSDLTKDGQLQRSGRGKYHLPRETQGWMATHEEGEGYEL